VFVASLRQSTFNSSVPFLVRRGPLALTLAAVAHPPLATPDLRPADPLWLESLAGEFSVETVGGEVNRGG
jgi:hypothetical protein